MEQEKSQIETWDNPINTKKHSNSGYLKHPESLAIKGSQSEVQEAAPCNRAAPCNERIFYGLLKTLNNFTDPEKENITQSTRASSNPKTNTVSWRMDVHTCLTYYVESHLITSLYSWFILIRDVPSVSSVALDPPRPCSPSSGQRFSAT